MSGVQRITHIMSGAPCISGTRILSRSVWEFYRSGFTPTEIMREYPTLRLEQIEAAIRYERVRRMKAWEGGSYGR